MNNTFSIQQKSQTANLDSSLILGQYKLYLRAQPVKIKTVNPRLTLKEIAKEIRNPTSSLQRNRQDIIMRSPYRIQPNSHKRK